MLYILYSIIYDVLRNTYYIFDIIYYTIYMLLHYIILYVIHMALTVSDRMFDETLT